GRRRREDARLAPVAPWLPLTYGLPSDGLPGQPRHVALGCDPRRDRPHPLAHRGRGAPLLHRRGARLAPRRLPRRRLVAVRGPVLPRLIARPPGVTRSSTSLPVPPQRETAYPASGTVATREGGRNGQDRAFVQAGPGQLRGP